jgi:succinate dehydrogenase flavin-adding protein (antitoxin of CptAB toxin-antitoxin module)
MLTTYLERSYDLASSSEQRSFLELLELPDPDLQRILLNPTSADGEAVNLLVSKIRAHFSL